MSIVAAGPPGNSAPVSFAADCWHEQHPHKLDIEQRLPADRRARFFDAAVGLVDLNPLWQSYGGTGSLPHRPNRLLAAVLYELSRGERSPALWYRDARENEPMRWLLRGSVPCRSCWYNFRDRIAPYVDDVNQQVLQRALAAGITFAEQGSLDGTLVSAHASRHKLVKETALQQRLTQLEPVCAADQAPPSPVTTTATAELPTPEVPAATPALAAAVTAALPVSLPCVVALEAVSPPLSAHTPPLETTATPTEAAGTRPGWMAPTPRGRRQQLQRLRQAKKCMAERQTRNSNKRAGKRKERDKIVLSVSDPEAALGRDKEKVYRPLYNVQLVDDLDSPLILGCGVFAQPNDAGLLGPMMTRTKALLGHALKKVLADTAYAGGADLAAAAAADLTLYAPLPKESGRKDKYLSKQLFVWSPATATYTCPQGHELEYAGSHQQKRSGTELVVLNRYRCPPEHCTGCPQQSHCTPCPERGRTISRGEHEDLIEALRARMATPEAKALYRLRSQTVELVNADFKEHRKLRRFSSRGLKRAQAQVGLMVLAHNLLVLIKHGRTAEIQTRMPGDATQARLDP